jgi:uncharacterized protein YndB with AHSA1/START domain
MVQLLSLLEREMSFITPWFRKDPVLSYAIGGKIYTGSVNQHKVLIRTEPEKIYAFLIDLDQWGKWVSPDQISVEKVTAGEFRVGTRLHFKLRFRIQPEWDTEVIHLEKDRQIIFQFLNGIFEGGIEIWNMKKKDVVTEVMHTLLYQIHRRIYKIGWGFLGGEKKHNELTELALGRLKTHLEQNP